MDIELHCQGCGKLVRAPRESAGRRAKCPACGRELYIPTPAAELQELPLAPEDLTFLQQEAKLQAERRRLDRILSRDDSTGSESQGHRPAGGPETGDIDAAVINYLRALSRSDLGGAEQLLPMLRRQRAETIELLDRLAADQMPPSALGNVPPGVYQGFLKHLRMQLSS